MAAATVHVGGPFFDDLAIGTRFDTAPSVTFTDGLAAVHQSIVGDRLRLPLDADLSRRAGGGATFVHPGLVTDVAIGQSTLATHHVRANLFYRGLRFLALPRIGDTMHTVTTVVGLCANTPKPNRTPTGLAALHIRSTDQTGRTILNFYRCAMLPFGSQPSGESARRADDLSTIGVWEAAPPLQLISEINLSVFRAAVPGRHFSTDLVGRVFLSSGDVVSSAPELARSTLNIAATHHDARTDGRRLVYGGHTIGIAAAQAARALPNIVTIVGWDACDHTGPVREGDTLTSELTVVQAHALATRGGTLDLRSVVTAHPGDNGEPHPVLDWRFTVLMA